MIEIPVHNSKGEKVDVLSVDEAILGGEVRHELLKQAFVRYHANQRQGSAKTKNRSETAFSTRKMYRQKGTGNARRGSAGTNIMRKGGMPHAKRPRDFSKKMPMKMKRLANRNAILAKAVDGEIKLIDALPGSDGNKENMKTKSFAQLLTALGVDRTCVVALEDTRGAITKAARNIEHVNVSNIDQLNVFTLLNNRFLVATKAEFEAYLERVKTRSGKNGAPELESLPTASEVEAEVEADN